MTLLLIKLVVALPVLAAMTPGNLGSRSRRQDQAPLEPFVLNHRAEANSSSDVSFLLDAPAGKDGYIRVRRGHFVKPDGKRIRFWGVHITEWSPGSVEFPPKEDAPMWAATLARHGVNIVRLHFLDLPSPRGLIDSTKPDTQSFDPGQLDRFDFWVAQLKKNGIYMDLNLNVGRSYKPGDGVHDATRLGWGKGVVYYDPRLIELQRDYANKLLTHRNPYTNTEYRNEPAIAIVEMVNENALYMGFRAPSPYYETELADLYNKWLAKHRSREELAALRKEAQVEPGAPIPRLQGAAIREASPTRYATELQFYRETERAFYGGMKRFLRDLGVRQPIIGTADHSHSGSSYAMLTDFDQMDIIDGHDYWQHPGARGTASAMVNDPLNSTVVELSRTAIAGKPYTVSETNHPFPNDYAAEGIPIMAAYASLQDWDMVIMYTFEPKLAKDWKPYVADPFDISHDPVRMNEMATGALMFLRGDVRPARQEIDRTYSEQQVVAAGRLPGTDRPYFTPGFPLQLPLMHRVRIKSFNGPPTASYPPTDANPIVSDTGELTWFVSKKTGMVTIDTDRTQALVGFISENDKKTLKNLSVGISNPFASVVLSSMDGKPISQASHLLMTACSKVENTGMVWNRTHSYLTRQGGSPTLIEPVSGTITLFNLRGANNVRISPLDGSGHLIAAGEQSATHIGNTWVCPLGQVATTWYRIDISR